MGTDDVLQFLLRVDETSLRENLLKKNISPFYKNKIKKCPILFIFS